LLEEAAKKIEKFDEDCHTQLRWCCWEEAVVNEQLRDGETLTSGDVDCADV
jgi:hypothetical protein